MPILEIAGLEIDFPYESYACQKDYMKYLIQAIEKGENAILESPTGTGKTLCLLCASLAWVRKKKAVLPSNLGTSNFILAGAVPRIIFASRTHSQLQQCVQALKNTVYKNASVAVIASRDQLCLLPEVRNLESNSSKIRLCRAKVNKRTCDFYRNFEVKRAILLDELKNRGVLDIEDLAHEGIRNGCCPYYISRDLKENAEILFMPYNYLLDRKSRIANGIELENSIIIFDEAHNIEQVCEDSASVSLTLSTVSSAIGELKALGQKLFKNEPLDEMNADFEEEVSLPFRDDRGLVKDFENNRNDHDDPVKKLTIHQLVDLKSQLHILEKEISNLTLENGEIGDTKHGSFVFEILSLADVNSLTMPRIVTTGNLVADIVASINESLEIKRTKGLDNFLDFVKTVFEFGDTAEHVIGGLAKIDSRPRQFELRELAQKYFRVHIKEEALKPTSSVWDRFQQVSELKKDRTISYWCLSPGRAMRDLIRHHVKCIILTSGTLYPIQTLILELNLSFPITLQNPHVIDTKDQIRVLVACNGPDGQLLNSSYENRHNASYVHSLGLTMINLARQVPRGFLIFFPSYSQMNHCIEHWRQSGLYDRLVSFKKVFVEPRDKSIFSKTIVDYKLACIDPEERGACLIAVMRGRASEGLDLSDHSGRAVAILGLPFPPIHDTRVRLKMAYLDEENLGISGREWYRIQAWRAINQAVGRVIRHRRDYGAVILCDERFASKDSRMQLPKWMHDGITVHNKLAPVLHELGKFYRNAENLYPGPALGLTNNFTISVSHSEQMARKRFLKRQREENDSKIASSNKFETFSAAEDFLSIYDKCPSTVSNLNTTDNLFQALEHSQQTFNSQNEPQIKIGKIDDNYLQLSEIVHTSDNQSKKRRLRMCSSENFLDSTGYLALARKELENRVDKAVVFSKFTQDLKTYSLNQNDSNALNRVFACIQETFPQNHDLLRNFVRFVREEDKERFKTLLRQLDKPKLIFSCVECKKENADTPLAAPCKHVACFSCWRKIIEFGRKECPFCKIQVKKKNLIKLNVL